MIIHCISIIIHESLKKSFYKDIIICSLSAALFRVHHRSCVSVQSCNYFLTKILLLSRFP